MTMHKALHPRDDVDRLYVFRKEGGRGLASIKDTVDASIQRLKDYIKKRTNHNHQKRYQQYDRRKSDNNEETKMGRKTTPWLL